MTDDITARGNRLDDLDIERDWEVQTPADTDTGEIVDAEVVE